jgi:hypothetical protein
VPLQPLPKVHRLPPAVDPQSEKVQAGRLAGIGFAGIGFAGISFAGISFAGISFASSSFAGSWGGERDPHLIHALKRLYEHFFQFTCEPQKFRPIRAGLFASFAARLIRNHRSSEDSPG